MKRRQPSSRVKLDPHKVWELLNRLNMTQNELARLVGTSSGYLSQLMSGTRCPSADIRRRLMEALGVTRFVRSPARSARRRPDARRLPRTAGGGEKPVRSQL